MAATGAITPTRFSTATEINAFETKGIKSYTRAYAAIDAWTPVSAFEQHTCYASLTGAMTINATVTNLQMFDRGYIYFPPDGTNRVVTFGTNFVSLGTLTTIASKDTTVTWIFDGTNIRIISREIGV